MTTLRNVFAHIVRIGLTGRNAAVSWFLWDVIAPVTSNMKAATLWIQHQCILRNILNPLFVLQGIKGTDTLITLSYIPLPKCNEYSMKHHQIFFITLYPTFEINSCRRLKTGGMSDSSTICGWLALNFVWLIIKTFIYLCIHKAYHVSCC